jgi:hypothetical protein
MKEANGEDVKLMENGKEYLVEPTADQIDDLMGERRENGLGKVRRGARWF